MTVLDKPKIAVIGAGAIGSLIGGLLARDGEDVTLVGKKAHIEAINADGLKVDGVAGEFTARPAAVEILDFKPDLAFVAVKNQDVAATCREIKTYMAGVPVVMMQNGVTSAEVAASVFGKANVISCVLMLNARFLSPGQVTYVNRQSIVVGRAFGENDAVVNHVQTLLGKVAQTEISGTILGVQWTKLLINVMGNALDGMTGLTLGEYIRYPEMRRIGILILKEALGLLDKAGFRPAPLPGLPLGFFKFMIRSPMPLATRLLAMTAKAKGDKDITTSTLQSLLKGKPTEIDYLNGEFVRLGSRLSAPAPVNAKVVELIHGIEKIRRFYTPAELAGIFEP